MIVIAFWPFTKWCKKNEKSLKTWHMGTHLRELSESYPMDTNVIGSRYIVFKIFGILVLWTKVASALEGWKTWKVQYEWSWSNPFLQYSGHLLAAGMMTTGVAYGICRLQSIGCGCEEFVTHTFLCLISFTHCSHWPMEFHAQHCPCLPWATLSFSRGRWTQIPFTSAFSFAN